MEKLNELSVSDLIALYDNCNTKDEAKIISVIEEKSGINISEEESLWNNIILFLTAVAIVLFTLTVYSACLKYITS